MANNIEENEGYEDDLNVSTSTFSSTTRASSSGASRVQVGEIYDTDSQTFDYTNLTILYGYLSGRSPNTPSHSGDSIMAMDWVFNVSSAYIYSKAEWVFCMDPVPAGTYNGVSYVAAERCAEVTVSFCGLVWQVVALSQDIYGNTIMTLWLDNVVQDILLTSSSNHVINGTSYYNMHFRIQADDYNTVNGGSFTYTNNDLLLFSPLSSIGARLGFIKLRYALDPSTGVIYEPSNSYSGLSKYLAFPCQIPWQQNQSAKEVLGLPYNLSNEACAIGVSDDGFYSSENNYSNYIDEDDGYQGWALDALWLPSLSEIGYSGKSGLWGMEESERSSNVNNSGTVGSGTAAVEIDNGVWTRSANYKQSYGYYFVKEGGSGKGVGALRAKVIRPAIHLNLTAIEAER